MKPHNDPEEVVREVEGRLSDRLYCAQDRGIDSAAEAMRMAAAEASSGKRTAVLLRHEDLFQAIEPLHQAVDRHLPLTVHVVSARPELGAPTAAWHDTSVALDVGAAVLMSFGAQDAVDLSVAARRASEDSETPFLVFTDSGGSVHSLPDAAFVHAFLGSRRAPRRGTEAASRVPFALDAAMRDLERVTNRPLACIDRFETADAEEVIVAVGHSVHAARNVALAARRMGKRVGVLGLRGLRPFLGRDIVKATSRAQAIVVLEPFDSPLSPSGRVAESLKGAYADALTWAPGFPGVGRIPQVVSVTFELLDGGVHESDVGRALEELALGDHGRRHVVLGSEDTPPTPPRHV